MSSSPAQTDERATGRDSLDGIKTRRPDGSGGAASRALAESQLAQPPSMAASRLVGLRVSPIGLGMAALGRPGYINLGHGRDLGADHSPQAIRRHAETATADALALAAVLARPWVDVALSGVANVGHLRSNLAALRIAWDDEAEADLAPLAEEPDQYWRTRARLAWN